MLVENSPPTKWLNQHIDFLLMQRLIEEAYCLNFLISQSSLNNISNIISAAGLADGHYQKKDSFPFSLFSEHLNWYLEVCGILWINLLGKIGSSVILEAG